MASRIGVIEWGPERARAGPWRGDLRVAYLAPMPTSRPPSVAFLRRCLGTLADEGFTSVITGALVPAEQQAFRAVGFEEHEPLHLLARDLNTGVERGDPERNGQDPAGRVRLRRARRADRARVLQIDGAAFRPFWRLDGSGLEEAVAATPSSRFRVAVDTTDRRVGGYAISGRGGRYGYLQRLAVDPRSQGRGLGRALVLDGLQWMRRRGVHRVVANTQPDNVAALVLYERLGFRRQPTGLAVLRRELPT